MSDQYIEIETEGVCLRTTRGFLVACKRGERTPNRIPLDRIQSVTISARDTIVTARAIAALGDAGVPLIVNGPSGYSSAIAQPTRFHHRQAEILRDQIQLTIPRKKRAWQKLAREKVANQGHLLKSLNGDESLLRWVPRIRSGDPDNKEAQAAAYYWPRLFGKAFVRRTDADDINRVLNYGYGVLRSTTAKAVLAAGMTPALGLHHHNLRNALQLVDDLIEPFRPAVDLIALRACEVNRMKPDPVVKRAFTSLMLRPLPLGGIKRTTLKQSINRLCHGLAESLKGSDPLLIDIPGKLIPVLLASESTEPLLANG